jgi:hypothetical protein
LFCVNVIAYNLLRLQICMAISCHVNEREIWVNLLWMRSYMNHASKTVVSNTIFTGTCNLLLNQIIWPSLLKRALINE